MKYLLDEFDISKLASQMGAPRINTDIENVAATLMRVLGTPMPIVTDGHVTAACKAMFGGLYTEVQEEKMRRALDMVFRMEPVMAYSRRLSHIVPGDNIYMAGEIFRVHRITTNHDMGETHPIIQMFNEEGEEVLRGRSDQLTYRIPLVGE